MESNNGSLPVMPPTQQPQEPKKWYKHKGILAVIILAIITAIVSYLAISRGGSNNLGLTKVGDYNKSLSLPTLGISASTVAKIEQPTDFTIPALPNVKFQVMRVAKATGAVSSSDCNNESKIFVQYAEPNVPKGMCLSDDFEIARENSDYILNFDAENSNVGARMNRLKGAWVIVDLGIINNSNQKLDSQFLQLSYPVPVYTQDYTTAPNKITDNGKTDDLIAEVMPQEQTYEIEPKSAKVIRLAFLVRDKNDEVDLLYGNFGNPTKYFGLNPFKFTLGKIHVNFTTQQETKTISQTQMTGAQSELDQEAASIARDFQRVQDVKNLYKTLLLDYYWKNGQTYPQTLDALVPSYLASLPKAPEPPDGSCTEAQNTYTYTYIDKQRFSLSFCLGRKTNEYDAGVNKKEQKLNTNPTPVATTPKTIEASGQVSSQDAKNTYITALVSSDTATALKVGQSAVVTFDAMGPATKFNGQVKEFHPVNSDFPNSNFQVTITIPLNKNVRTGMTANISIAIGQ